MAQNAQHAVVDASGHVHFAQVTTVEELQSAVAAVAPQRLTDLAADEHRAVSKSLKESSIGPLQAFMLHWRMILLIEQDPDLSRRYRAYEHTMRFSNDEAARRTATLEMAEIVRTAGDQVRSG
ncbi:hypothetical protein AB0442_39100 [Kitasatospora sp. NPDC085895]|uniref:hypothetical protein n=1 Tax=Kitasatospora sp. NPDC085895 TaxID=3155057 RepID=UPI00344B6203